MALLSFRGITTPSLQAQGEQRRFSYFNIGRDNSEASAGNEHRRDQAIAGGGEQPEDARSAQPRLWLRIAGERDRAAQGQAYRQGTEDHSHRAVEGSQGPQCDAAAGDAWLAAAMVEGASLASRW